LLYLTYPINYMGKNATRSRFLDEILKEEWKDEREGVCQ
jgi:hypothetical protein